MCVCSYFASSGKLWESMVPPLHGEGQGFDSPRLHSLNILICRSNLKMGLSLKVHYGPCDTNLTLRRATSLCSHRCKVRFNVYLAAIFWPENFSWHLRMACASCSAYPCVAIFPCFFAVAQASCNAADCSAGDLVPSKTSWNPVNISSLKFCGASTSML